MRWATHHPAGRVADSINGDGMRDNFRGLVCPSPEYTSLYLAVMYLDQFALGLALIGDIGAE